MEYRGNIQGSEYRSASGYRNLPICCIVLIAANGLIFLTDAFWPRAGVWMEMKGSFSVVYLLYGREYYRLVTSAFLHADIGHLVNNMILLYFCGELVEKTLGRFRFLVLYLLSAVCGNLLSAAYELSTGSFYDSIGASGAVFGLTGALLFCVIVKKGAAAHISMKRMVLAVALSLYAGFSSAYVNNAAHVGGLLSGFLLAFLLSLIPRLNKKRA